MESEKGYRNRNIMYIDIGGFIALNRTLTFPGIRLLFFQFNDQET